MWQSLKLDILVLCFLTGLHFVLKYYFLHFWWGFCVSVCYQDNLKVIRWIYIMPSLPDGVC